MHTELHFLLVVVVTIVLGVTFSLRGKTIPSDGSGRVLITNINPNGDNNETALICRSDIPTNEGGNWYLHPTEQSTDDGDRIVSSYGASDRGWHRNRGIDSEGHRIVRLWRGSSTAREGVFTCHFAANDSENAGNDSESVGIYYSSESNI